VRSGDAPLDDGFLSLLWLERDNGIASLPQGVMPKSEFGQSIERLRELTQQLMSSPDSDQLNQINLAWVEAVKNKTFSTRRPASIHRVLAAIAPALYSTLVNESDCQVLLVGLGREFQLRSTAPSGANWCELNHSLKRSFSEAGLDDTDSDTPQALEHNIAMWQLMSALKEKRVSTAEEISFMPSSAQQLGDRPQLNQILYGPPGTGKTHSTVIEALRILEPALLTDPLPERDELFDAFKGYQDAGQVVFCTFHQSFSYEDFVEGIRAETLDGELNYKLESGVFKELCDRAGSGRISANDPFDKAFTVFTAALDNLSGRLSMATVQGNSFDVGYAGTDTFRVFINGAAQSTIRGNVSHVRQLYQTGETQGIYSLPYVRGMLNYLLQHCGLPPYKASKAVAGEQDKFVLIIDEINRGNISRIFGELITLIEPSKRAGAGQGEVSQVILPYSKKPFSVPSNLYLIGTMNTSDRSLVGLDIALRRRFAFKEMPPCPKLLDDVWVESEDLNIGKMLAVMNQRIEVLLDRNHCLGHAYFMELKRSDTPPKLSELAVIFKQKILPLLQEYFFEDWERIGWVLNDQNALENGSQPFVRAPDQETSLQKLFGAKVASNLQDRRWSLNQQAFGSVDNYLNILR
jgi:5-methylcytosine-specific restriction protein B